MLFSDGHCDYLYKISKKMTTVVTPSVLEENKVIMQNFAIFAEPTMNSETMYNEIVSQLEIFKKDILNTAGVVFLTNTDQIEQYYINKKSKMLAVLSIEGCDAISRSNNLFNKLWSSGVRIYGLTWNRDNQFATSCTTKTMHGLSEAGSEFVNEIMIHRGIIDVSHLSERAFWDIVNYTNKPSVIASHSNCSTLCNHNRNITNEQIKAIIKCDGVIGINFVPMFLNLSGNAKIVDVIRHIEKIIELGGCNNVAIGSDFDGAMLIDELSTPRKLFRLAEELHKRYDQSLVKKITHLNWLTFLQKKLPKYI